LEKYSESSSSVVERDALRKMVHEGLLETEESAEAAKTYLHEPFLAP